MLLEAQSDMEVAGEAGDGTEVVRKAQALRPDVVLLDLSMPGPSSGDTIRELVRLAPGPRVLVLTMHDDPASMQAALLAGASGYVVKQVADVELLTAIRAVHRGRTFVELTRPAAGVRRHEGGRPSRDAPAPRQPKLLSPREAEVLQLLAQGHTYQEAADRLAVSVKTIETHRKRLTDKLGLTNRAELYRFAVQFGLLERE
jgi:two-component system response regulator NreC